MARRSDKPQAELLEVVKGIAECMDFELAAIARACVDLADRQTASELCARAIDPLASSAISGSLSRGAGSVSGLPTRLLNKILRMVSVLYA